MATIPSGIKKVEYDTAVGFGTAVDLGTPLADSAGYSPDAQAVEAADGTMLYSGLKKVLDMNFSDTTKFAALETIMKADTRIYIRLTLMDDSTVTLISSAAAQVKMVYPFQVGKKVSFNLKTQAFEV